MRFYALLGELVIQHDKTLCDFRDSPESNWKFQEACKKHVFTRSIVPEDDQTAPRGHSLLLNATVYKQGNLNLKEKFAHFPPKACWGAKVVRCKSVIGTSSWRLYGCSISLHIHRIYDAKQRFSFSILEKNPNDAKTFQSAYFLLGVAQIVICFWLQAIRTVLGRTYLETGLAKPFELHRRQHFLGAATEKKLKKVSNEEFIKFVESYLELSRDYRLSMLDAWQSCNGITRSHGPTGLPRLLDTDYTAYRGLSRILKNSDFSDLKA